ncbi:MAG: M1 family metallopeptidase [Gemmatimonadota bacterium]|nr:M1 family metallopeptidase [Gemmatimonadota bacterium]MDE3007253.1 M1 family metallopeptidase [Gemmatimonadota bacterium]MDE3015019.1 M1 family metallopeptidase [Gemmatimonadota bacterium]
MRHLLLISALFAVGPGPSPTPTVDDYPRRSGIDIENYRFELILSDETDVVSGRATVSVRFTDSGVAELPLDLIGLGEDGYGMTVHGASSAGTDLAWVHEDDLLTITLGEPGRAGVLMDVEVAYSGVPASGLVAGPNRYGDRTFFSDNWPNRARNWLPTIDHPYDKAMNEMVVTAPAHYQVVSNGVIVEETDRGDGTRTTHWKNSVPIATWLYVLGVAEFAVQQVDDFEGRAIETWVYRQDRDLGFYDFAVPTKAAMEFYDEYVGPYAYERIANITSPVTGGGMEAATSIMYHESSVTGERTVRWRNVIIHEVAHQWFGNAVTESDWDDVWLSEGFATYFTLLFIEHAYGRDEFVAGLRSSAERVFTQYETDPQYRIVHDDLSDMRRVTSGATYQKGSWVLHMLRSQVGDEVFWRGIREYYARYMNGNATTTDFRTVMEEASGLDLGLFFEQWLYNGGNPRLEGWWDYDASTRAVRIEINQTQTAGPTFELPLEIGIHFDATSLPGTIHDVVVDARSHRFVIPVDEEPTHVTLDPNVKTLFESEFGPRQ